MQQDIKYRALYAPARPKKTPTLFLTDDSDSSLGIVINLLRQNGLCIKGELHKFWFAHEEACYNVINSHDVTLACKVTSILRWRTETGKKLKKAIIDFVDEQYTLHNQNHTNESFYTQLDFNKLERSLKLNSCLYSITQKAGYFSGVADLRGLNLPKFQFASCIIANAIFSYSNFTLARFNQVKIIDCIFVGCNFHNALFGGIRGNIQLPYSNFSGCSFNAININAKTLGEHSVIEKITYLNLLLAFFSSKLTPETKFSNVTVEIGGSVNQRKALEYIYWNQNTMNQLAYSTSLVEKIGLFFSCLFTKNWSSFPVVLLWDLFFIVFFALCYYFIPNEFPKIDGELIKSVYLSVVTFTTLGYGDITPNGSLGMLLVTLEVIIGYIFLGISVILVGRQIKV